MQNLSTKVSTHLSIIKNFLLFKKDFKNYRNISVLNSLMVRSGIILIFIFVTFPPNLVLNKTSLSKPNSESPFQKTKLTEEKKKIDINTASLEDLIKIIHIGERRAKELISLRPFHSLDELTKIKGIGIRKIQDIKKQGLAWIDPNLKLSKIEKTKKETAFIAEPLKEKYYHNQVSIFFSLFSTAFSLAIFSGIIILILKKKIKK